MINDLVSIIMPSFNTAQYIKESIESVLAQTYELWELIIVDDCSKDETDKVVAPFLVDERIRYIKMDTNSGAAASRNRALRVAKGRYIAFLDSDDLWNCKKLEKQLEFMKNNNYCFTYTRYSEIDSNSKKRDIVVSGPRRITKFGMYSYCWPGCLTVMYDAKEIGLIQIKHIKKNNDYAMWLKIIEKENCYLLDEDLASYRKREGSISNVRLITLIQWHYKLFREALEKGRIISGVLTFNNLIFGTYKKIRYVRKQ